MFRTLALTLLVATPALAGSKGDWFASLYTGEGVELRNDERVFTLFAILNATGFDQGPVTRKDPVPKVNYHPVRQQVRARVIGGDPEVRKAADAFFDAHPTALRKYLSYAVASDTPPFAAGAKAKDLQDLKGLEQVLGKAWTGWKLEELMGSVQGDYRKVLKSYLSGTDFPLARARTLLKVPETTESLIVVNLLDAQNEVRAVSGEQGEAFLIVGPSDQPNVEGVIREFARLYVEPVVAKQVGKWAGGVQVLREAQLAGATDQTLQDYATQAVATAIALRSIEAPDAAWEAAAAKGYFGIKDISKLFDEGKPLDAIVMDAMQKLETRRPAKK
jgi:predicted transcriptional regulator